MMRWHRLGQLFCSTGQSPFFVSHASCPMAVHQHDHTYKIWCSPRDRDNRSHSAWVEFDIREPNQVTGISAQPVLAPGPELGAFDERGAMFSWIVRHEGRQQLFYTGWSLGASVPWRLAIGRAEIDSSGTAHRTMAGPVLDRSPVDPYFVSNPCLIVDENGWQMWYLSGTGWEAHPQGLPTSRYRVHRAVSSDGLRWTPDPTPSIDYQSADEVAIARPCVLKVADGYEMYYCYRSRTVPYQIGYARSQDGSSWTRLDHEIELVGAVQDWESGMQAYPHVFSHEGRTYMVYCGNTFSKGGIGLAVLEV